MRFVSDDPPAALVDRMAQTFTKTDGDIREVLRTLFKSPEFWAPEAYRAKVKTPLEFVASAIRATGVEIDNPRPLVQALNRMGEPLYQMQPPTGYSMKADAWVNSAALLDRMNFALQLAGGRLPGIKFEPESLVGTAQASDPQAVLSALEKALLGGGVSVQTHETILKQMEDPQVTAQVAAAPARAQAAPAHVQNAAVIAGLLLGSPEFQRR
jgi:uncharacterized protein (DUF1800 family)